ncbi:MAG TPA: enoyl-CoA hydratase-related protein [Thermodesulfobacteriota bacterium]|nr:enoyl-CoA hydratase-related protein [Thermodesulfobacteriota bacterium]
MAYNTLLLEISDGIALLKINRPEVMNALNREVLLELSTAFQELETDENVKVVIVTGQGKAFVAGADIKWMVSLTPQEARRFSKLGHMVMVETMGNIGKPIIAAVNGFALGGGLELALACDFIYASDDAKFGQPEINLGIIPGFGGTQRLARLIGKALAKELIYTGQMIGAQEAKLLGIVNKVFPAVDLLAETKKVALSIASKGAWSLRLAKSAIETGYDIDLKSGCSIEGDSFGLCFSHPDQKEGMTAFLEKRKPTFIST